jgi:SPP1 gp7 family putative phage head morphogenesis protein
MQNIQAQTFKHMLRNHRRSISKVLRRKQPRMFVPPYPLAIERQYKIDLQKHFKSIAEELWRVLTKENYERWVADYKRHDANEPIILIPEKDLKRADAFENEINQVIGTLRGHIEKMKDSRGLSDDLRKTVVGTYVFSKNQWRKQVQKVVGAEYSTDERWWEKARKAWINENEVLCAAWPEEFLKKVSNVMYTGVRSGWLWGDMAGELRKIEGDMTGRRAELIARDQVGKLNGQLSRFRQTELGLNYYVWTAVGDERECEICRLIDGALCRWDDPDVMSLDNGETWIDRPEALQGAIPGDAHPQCFLGEIPVRSLVPVEKLYRRRYIGKGTTFIFNDGKSLTCTPNHPILRADGKMISAQFLNIEDKICNIPYEVLLPFEDNPENGITSFQQLFDFCSVLFGFDRGHTSTGDFHGDGIIDEQVNIINLKSPLDDYVFTKKQKRVLQKFFSKANVSLSFLLGDSSFLQTFKALGFPFNCFMSLLSKLFFFINGHSTETDEVCIRTVAELNAVFFETGAYRITSSMIFSGKPWDAFTIAILFDKSFFRQLFFIGCGAGMVYGRQSKLSKAFMKLVSIDSKNFGKLNKIAASFHSPMQITNKIITELDVHVYNLQNSLGWYIVTNKGIIVKNCRCQALAFFGDIIQDVDSEDGMNTDSLYMSPRQRADALKQGKRGDSFDPETTAGQKVKALTLPKQPDDTLLDDNILSKAFDFLYANAKINLKFDVPYLAGYSLDRKTIYIDRHFPQFMIQGVSQVDVWKYVVGHERIEDVNEKGNGLPYQLAHQLALWDEKAAVEADGWDWDYYNDFCNKYIKLAGNEQLQNIPEDLDIKPYEDENDVAVIKAMMEAKKKPDNKLGSGTILPAGDSLDSDEEGQWVTINGQHVLLGKGGKVLEGNPKVMPVKETKIENNKKKSNVVKLNNQAEKNV